MSAPWSAHARRAPAALRRGWVAALALALLLWGLPVQARLVQEQISVPVQVKDRAGNTVAQSIVVTLYRDTAWRKPQPVAVLSHGRPASRAAQMDMGRVRFAEAARYFVERGYVVAVPVRIGYGASDGADVEVSGNCTRRNFGPGIQAAAGQILAVLDAVQQRPEAARGRSLLVGHSYGGVASLAAAAQRPADVAAVINFSGGAGGDAATRPGQPCSTVELAQQLREIGSASRVPGLWLYASNDRYFGATQPRQWLDAYHSGGGMAEFVAVRRLGADGHTLFTHFPIVWRPLVTSYLNRLTAGKIAPAAMR